MEFDEERNRYKNPLSDTLDTADPCIIYNERDGYYYGIYTGDDRLVMHRAKRVGDMFSHSEFTTVYQVSEEDGTYGFLWAPEIHVIDGIWHIYTSTHEKNTKARKHVICLVAKGENPFLGFRLLGHINPDLYAIDPTVHEWGGRLYICSSAVLDGMQKLIIQELESPAVPKGEWSVIAEPEYDWERVYPYDGKWSPINEGAYFIEREGRLFIVYSGNGCWSDDYVMGILELVSENPLLHESWHKHRTPFMTKGNGCFGPGHATFFYSPDKTELWICHHCLHESDPEFKPMDRHCHIQKVFFDEKGFPHADKPLSPGVYYDGPSKNRLT